MWGLAHTHSPTHTFMHNKSLFRYTCRKAIYRPLRWLELSAVFENGIDLYSVPKARVRATHLQCKYKHLYVYNRAELISKKTNAGILFSN